MLAVIGLGLVGGGYMGLRRAHRAQIAENPEPLPPNPQYAQAPPDTFLENEARQTDLNKPFPAQAPPNGLGKDRYLNLDAGQSSTFLERYNGIPAVPTRKLDPPAPYAPQPQGQRTDGQDARQVQNALYVGSMSQFRNDESPIAKTQVGPGVGYDASVPAADGLHPRLRVAPTTSLSQRNPSRSLPPTAAQFYVSKPEAAAKVMQNAVPTHFEMSHKYTTSAPHASHSNPAPVLRGNFKESMKETTRETEMPALKGDCVDANTSLYGYGAGPPVAAGSQQTQVHSTYDKTFELRHTDRGWAGLEAAGPSVAAGDVPGAHMERGHWGSTLRAQARDATSLDPERLGNAGPSNAQPGGTARPQDELQTQGRELIPGLPTINTNPQEVEGGMRSVWRDGPPDAAAAHLRNPHRASYVHNEYQAAPAARVPGPGTQRQISAFARGRLSKVTHREVIDREQFHQAGPHAGIGDMVRKEWNTFALRDATVLAGSMGAPGPNRANAFESSDFVKGPMAPARQLAVPRVDFYNERMPNIGQRGAMAYKPPTNVQENPNKFEVVDDRLDIAVDSVNMLDHAYLARAKSRVVKSGS